MSILIAEDDERTREFYQEAFPQFDIDLAADGNQLVAMAMQRPYRLILTDIGMPGMDGVEATQVIRGNTGPNINTCICALSGDRSFSTTEEARIAGFDYRFQKPISAQRLISLFLWASEPSMPIELIPVEGEC